MYVKKVSRGAVSVNLLVPFGLVGERFDRFVPVQAHWKLACIPFEDALAGLLGTGGVRF